MKHIIIGMIELSCLPAVDVENRGLDRSVTRFVHQSYYDRYAPAPGHSLTSGVKAHLQDT